MSRRMLSAGVAAAVTLGMLALAARNVRFAELWPVLSGARWPWIAVMVGIGLLDLLIRARRWQVLLSRSGARPSVRQLFQLEAIGLAVNNILFLRVGELARAFLAARELSISTATALASVAVERALDVAALLSLFCAAAAGAPDLVPMPIRRAALLALCGALGALVVLAAAEAPLSAEGAWEKRLRPWPKIHALVTQLAAGAAVLRSAGAAAQAAGLSLALWGVDAVMYWAGARALGLGSFMGYGRAVLSLSWAGASAALPAAPGAFGAFEAAVEAILEKFGAAPAAAFAYALFMHMVMYIIVTALGLVFLYRVGLTLGELRGALDRQRTDA